RIATSRLHGRSPDSQGENRGSPGVAPSRARAQWRMPRLALPTVAGAVPEWTRRARRHRLPVSTPWLDAAGSPWSAGDCTRSGRVVVVHHVVGGRHRAGGGTAARRRQLRDRGLGGGDQFGAARAGPFLPVYTV